MDERDYRSTPLSPEERRQAELRRNAEEKNRLIVERTSKIEAEYGLDLERRIEHQHLIDDEAVRKAAVQIIARKVAERELGIEELRSPHIEEAIGKAQAKLAAQEIQAGREPGTHEWKVIWDKTAHEVFDRKPSAPPSGGASQSPPPTPQPPTPPLANSGQAFQLTADQVLRRFGDPELQARYQQREGQREQQERSASPTPPTPAKDNARGNIPGERLAEHQRTQDKFMRESSGRKFSRDIDEDDHTRGPENGRGDGRPRGGGRSR